MRWWRHSDVTNMLVPRSPLICTHQVKKPPLIDGVARRECPDCRQHSCTFAWRPLLSGFATSPQPPDEPQRRQRCRNNHSSGCGAGSPRSIHDSLDALKPQRAKKYQRSCCGARARCGASCDVGFRRHRRARIRTFRGLVARIMLRFYRRLAAQHGCWYCIPAAVHVRRATHVRLPVTSVELTA
jgi:hypothetical protein